MAVKQKREWTEDQIKAARRMQENYESFMEMKYDEMKWELALNLKLGEEEVDELIDQMV